MIGELLTRGDIQKLVVDSHRQGGILAECAGSLWPAYEVDLTPRPPTGAFGFVNGERIERQYWLRDRDQVGASVIIVGHFSPDASDDELRRHFVAEIAKRRKELDALR